MGLFKKRVNADLAGNNITALVMDADDCWSDVCALRSYKTTGPVATCEMAFARAALAKSIFRATQSEEVADAMCAAADRMVLESFAGEDTDETQAFYHLPLNQAAPNWVANYLDNAFPETQLASILAMRLGVPGMAAIEIAPLFEALATRIHAILKPYKVVV